MSYFTLYLLISINDNLIEINKNTSKEGFEDEKDYYQYYEYTGKSSDFTLIISNDLTSDCNNDKCSLCFLKINALCGCVVDGC